MNFFFLQKIRNIFRHGPLLFPERVGQWHENKRHLHQTNPGLESAKFLQKVFQAKLDEQNHKNKHKNGHKLQVC
jgi:hypothetical protein